MWSMLKRLKGESGQSAILIALSLVLLCGFAALAIDIGVLSVDQGQLQNAADAAAMAAAWDLPSASAAESTAIQYAQLNGVSASDTSVTSPYQSSDLKIEVVCKRTVEYSFARVLGLKSKEIIARAVAEKSGSAGGAFGYALFSGDTNSSGLLGLYQNAIYVDGSVHSNNGILMTGSNLKFTGNVEAVNNFEAYVSSITIGGTCQGKTITAYGSSINIPNRLTSPANIISMPDFSAETIAEAQASGTAYQGNKQYNGSTINVSSPVYVNGSINVAASSYTGAGVMIASGNIQLSGNVIAATADSAVCIYSQTGNINISVSNIQIDGILYAPQGEVMISASNIVINGRVIAKKVQLQGSNIQIISSTKDLTALPGGSVQLVE